MTDNFIPIVSNTPPPINDGDFDDDFTDFAQATNTWESDDDDFGDFSGPPPVSDDSLGSPLKSAQHQPFETHFSPIVDNIEAQDEIMFTAQQNDVNSNATDGTNETFEGGCEPDLSFPHDATVTSDISTDEKGTEFLDCCADDNNSFVMSHTENETGASSRFHQGLQNSITEPDAQGNLVNPVTAEFESDNSESFSRRDDFPIACMDRVSRKSPPSDESVDGDERITANDNFTEITNTYEKENRTFFNEAVESETASPVDSMTTSVQNDADGETKLIVDNCSLGSDDKDSTPISTDSTFAEKIVKKSSDEDDEVIATNDQEGRDIDCSPAESENKNQENAAKNCEDSVTFDEPADHSAEFVNFVSFSQSGNNNESKETLPLDNFNEMSDSVTRESATSTSIKSDKQDTKLSSVEESNISKLKAELNEEDLENDFADFSSFSFQSMPQVAERMSPSHNEDTFAPPNGFQMNIDDFADFDDDGFGDFSENNFASVEVTNDDDFGDFGSTSKDISFTEPTSTGTQSNDVTEKISKIPRWFPKCDNSSRAITNQSEDNINLIHCHVEENIIPLLSCDSASNPEALGSNKFFKSVCSPTQLWDLLEDVDNAIALKFKWNNSMNHQQLLTSLGINKQNILFSGNSAPTYVPNYAAGLGLLQPDTKPMSAADVVTATTPTEKAATIDGATAWTTETGAAHSRSHSNADAGSLASTGGYDAISLDFDALDVSASKSSKSPSPPEQDKMDPELLEFALTVTPDTAQAKRSDPLSKILASLKVSSNKKIEDEEEELTTDATEILTKLPDLSYMRSHVLMFPVGKPSVISNS